MALNDLADQYFTYEGRLASFQTAQQLSKRRASSANSKAPKSLKWPHKFLSPQELAKAGFFYYPLPANPDNVACFLCHKSLDGWEEDDDPLAEHLKHSPDCGWAIVATIEKQDGDLSEESPSSSKMTEARRATFADKWPHDNKKGWKCKTKQMVDAGWKYTPTPEYDDMATCAYCALALDGWENSDKPMDEHLKRSPECTFFTLIQNQKQSPAGKKTKVKRDRTSKTSRLSTQSAFTVASEGPSLADIPAEDEDSVLTTATTSTATGKKMGKGKRAPVAKAKKSRAKKTEPVDVETAPEPEDADFEVKVNPTPKPTRGRKRKSDLANESIMSIADADAMAPPPKRRATRTRGSTIIDDLILHHKSQEPLQPKGRKVRASTKSTRKTSSASVASMRGPIPNDEEIDQALEADLERPMSDEEGIVAAKPALKKGTRGSKIAKASHTMFGTESLEIDEAAIEAELQAMKMESRAVPKPKSAKDKQPRKVSVKQQAAAAKKAAEIAEAEAEAEAERKAEVEASLQISTELEHSISIQNSSPIVQPKRQRASSRQPARKGPKRATRASVISTNEDVLMTGNLHETVNSQRHDSGNESDDGMASQSTVVKGGAARRGSTMKKGTGRKNVSAQTKIESIQSPEQIVDQHVAPELPEELEEVKEAVLPDGIHDEPNWVLEESSVASESIPSLATDEPDEPVMEEFTEESTAPNIWKAKVPKAGARLQKAATSLQVLEDLEDTDHVMEDSVPLPTKSNWGKGKGKAPVLRSPTPTPKETTPSQSPQSSDAENQPPSSKPSATTNRPTTPHATTIRVPLASTPLASPSKRNIIAGLQSEHPWTAVNLDALFMKSPNDENSQIGLLGDAIQKAKKGELTSREKNMTVEEWIIHNASMAEDKLRSDCERMVGLFEQEGGRAMRALEGVECAE